MAYIYLQVPWYVAIAKELPEKLIQKQVVFNCMVS